MKKSHFPWLFPIWVAAGHRFWWKQRQGFGPADATAQCCEGCIAQSKVLQVDLGWWGCYIAICCTQSFWLYRIYVWSNPPFSLIWGSYRQHRCRHRVAGVSTSARKTAFCHCFALASAATLAVRSARNLFNTPGPGLCARWIMIMFVWLNILRLLQKYHSLRLSSLLSSYSSPVCMLANPAIKSQSGDIPRASFHCPWSARHGVKRQHCSVTLPLQVGKNCPSGLRSAKSTRKGDWVTWQSWFWWKIARRCCKHIPELSLQISVMAYVCSIHASITRVTYTLGSLGF